MHSPAAAAAQQHRDRLKCKCGCWCTCARGTSPSSSTSTSTLVRVLLCLGIAICVVVSAVSMCTLLEWDELYWLQVRSPSQLQDMLFNERLITSMPSQANNSSRIHTGLAIMANTTACFLGTARNAEHALPRMLMQIERLSVLFESTCAIFVEGDSHDATPQILHTWARLSPYNRTIISYSTRSIPDPQNFAVLSYGLLPREGRIAVSRNLGLDILRSMSEREMPEFVIMLDLDVLAIDPMGIADTFGRDTPWDVVCSYGVTLHGIYRDIYAFRVSGIDTNHHLLFEPKPPHLQALIDANRTLARSHINKFMRKDGRSLMPVQSCFGGLTIYRRTKLDGCRYSYRWNTTMRVDCEHVLFHHCIRERNAGRVFTNPLMKLWYGQSIHLKTPATPGALPGS